MFEKTIQNDEKEARECTVFKKKRIDADRMLGREHENGGFAVSRTERGLRDFYYYFRIDFPPKSLKGDP